MAIQCENWCLKIHCPHSKLFRRSTINTFVLWYSAMHLNPSPQIADYQAQTYGPWPNQNPKCKTKI